MKIAKLHILPPCLASVSACSYIILYSKFTWTLSMLCANEDETKEK